MKSKPKNLIWLFVLVALTVCTVLVIAKANKSFTFEGFVHCVHSMSPLWFAAAVLCSFGFVYFEGASLRYICSFFGYKFGRYDATFFSASDIYFSAITPSAAGGQPAALYFMVKGGVSGAVSAIALLLNLVMYTLSILIISGVCMLLRPQIFTHLDVPAKIFVGFGAVIQVTVIFLFLICIFKDRVILKVAEWGLKILRALHLVKDYDLQHEKLLKSIEQYKQCGRLLKKEPKLLLVSFVYNFAQRLSVIMVAVCIFIGTGGPLHKCFAAFCAQAMAVLGSNAVPIPGAVGVADYIFLRGFERLVPDPVSVELLSRGVSFYGSFIFCGLLLLITITVRKIKAGRGPGDRLD